VGNLNKQPWCLGKLFPDKLFLSNVPSCLICLCHESLVCYGRSVVLQYLVGGDYCRMNCAVICFLWLMFFWGGLGHITITLEVKEPLILTYIGYIDSVNFSADQTLCML
jgi:hypothetical protein